MNKLLPLFIATILLGCSPPDESEEQFEPQVATTEPGDDESAPLAAGESITIERENRDAVLAVLKGVASMERGQPLKFDLIRSIDRPIYRDVDESDGPKQWITIAEIQDDDGNVLWFDRVNTLYQLLEYLELVLNQQSNLTLSINQVFQFIEMQYPQLLEFAVKVPTGIEGGTQYVLKVPKEDGELYEAWRADISDLVDNAEAPRLEGEAETILENGEPEDTIDVVILGDGYTAEEREKFTLDAQAIADRFVKTEPLKSTEKAFNIHTIWTPSEESGAGYDCTGIITLDDGCKEDLRDTPFETVFVITALADKLGLDLASTSDRVAMPLQIGKLFEAATAVPFDEIIMISNTNRTSGFAGLYVSILTSYDPRLTFPDTAVHEFGHSFGVLGDEYDIEGDPCLANEPRIPLPNNISPTASLDDLKWSHWIEDGTPLPTPPEQADEVTVGAYESAYNCDEMYRPSHRCKMKDSTDDFCPVCTEQMVARIYSVLDPAPLGEIKATHTEEDTLSFEVPVREDLSSVTWFLGDEEFGDGAKLEVEAGDVPAEWTQLRAEVVESSGFVKSERPRLRETHSWWIRR